MTVRPVHQAIMSPARVTAGTAPNTGAVGAGVSDSLVPVSS